MEMQKLLSKSGVQGISFYADPEIEKQRYNPYRLRNRQLAEWDYKNQNNPEFPRHIIIETSSLCQMKCGFCNREVISRPQMNMELDVFKKAIDQAAEMGVYSVSMYALGEPFLNPHLREMILYAKGAGIPYVDISTNGMLPMLKVLGTGLDEIIVSLDGFEHTYHKLRRGGNWHRVVENTEKLRKERDRLNLARPLIRIQIIDLWETREDVKPDSEFIRWALGLGDVVYVKNVEAFSHTLGAKNLPQTQIVKRLSERKSCKQLYFALTVDSDGAIEACCHSPQGKATLGHVGGMTLKEAWIKLRPIRERHEKGDYSDLGGICSKCIDQLW